MSKSLEFCQTTARDPSRSTFADRNWENAREITETEAIFDQLLGGARNLTLRKDGGEKIGESFNINIEFDPDADFDYFTSDVVTHDGTLLFYLSAMHNCIQNVFTGSTYNKNIGKTEWGDNITYVVGNFVILSEIDSSFAPVDRPNIRERTTVLLPLKMMKG